jgi:mRNA-degrading endonuclease RelE of RelBE toxin-antitoxin system
LKRYEVLLSQTAVGQLRDLPVNVADRTKRALAELEEDPFHPRPKADIKRMKGPVRDYYRQRIGDHRAIHVVDGHRVLVAKILPRSKAYDWLE